MISFTVHRLVGKRPTGETCERWFAPGVALPAVKRVYARWLAQDIKPVRLERYEGSATRTVLEEHRG